MNGNYSFESLGGSDGLVLNQGTLQAAPGGFIALLGHAVANEGLIVADAGTIAVDGAAVKEDVTPIALCDEAEVLVITVPLDHARAQPWGSINSFAAVRAFRWCIDFESHVLLDALFLDPVNEFLAAGLTRQ